MATVNFDKYILKKWTNVTRLSINDNHQPYI